MILHHFTSFAAAQDILADGVIRAARGEVGAGFPAVVWLTADPGREFVFDGEPGDPAVVLTTAYRFTVDVPVADVSHWRDWQARHGRGLPLAACAAEVAAYKARWHVVERPIPRAEWVSWDWAVSTELFAEALASTLGGAQ